MRGSKKMTLRERLLGRRGFVFAFFALAAVVLLGMTGLAIDTARGVVTKAEISRVVDATALAEARNVRAGVTQAQNVARAVAALNGIEPGPKETLTLPPPITNNEGETLITVRASRRIETTFMRLMGIDDLEVSSFAEATVPPVDLVLVLDQSGSMKNRVSGGSSPWSKLVPAAKEFVRQFSDEIDQVGLVHYSTMAETALPLQPGFTRQTKQRISVMVPSGDTNAEEALDFAWTELSSKRVRPKALRVIVFFTDGRPTAFRDDDKTMGSKDGILTTVPRRSYGDVVLGWYSAPENPPAGIQPDANWQPAQKCLNVSSCKIPAGDTWVRDEVLEAAREKLLENAAAIRSSGIFIYSIGLGNLTGVKEEQPDQDLLREVANVNGRGVGTRGGYFFANTPEDLGKVFQAVAADILARLSQ
jgi:Flp pilus assembly protein TadG